MLPFLGVTSFVACAVQQPIEDVTHEESLEAPAAAQEQHEVIAEHFGQHAIGVRLSTPTDGAQVEAITVELRNTTNEARSAWLDLGATIVGAEPTRRSYGPYAIAAGASVAVRVSVDELPIQASHIPVRMTFASRERRSDGVAVRGTGAAARLHFDLDRKKVALHAVDSAFKASWAELEHVPTTVIGHIFDEKSAQFRELTTDILTLSPTARITGTGLSFKAVPEGAEQVPELPGDVEGGGLVEKAASTMFCPLIDYGFDDSGLGESVYADGGGFTPVSFHYLDINRNGADFWGGWLGSSGCSPTRTTSAGRYTLELFSALWRNPVEIWIGHVSPLDFVATQSIDIAISAGTPSLFLPVYNFGPLDLQNGAAVAKQALLNTHVPMATGSSVRLKIMLDEGCGNGSGCFVPSTTNPAIKLGRNEAMVQHAFTKFVIGHELGHFVSFRHFGSLSNNLNLNSSAAVCACGHVRPEIDRSHCLQSHEGISVAQQEGFAHFAATLMLNDPINGYPPCAFNYYKQFAWFGDPSDTNPQFIQEPAIAFRCELPHHWLLNNCPAAERGTELDWLAFYWALMRPGNMTWAELRTMYRTACGEARCNGDIVTWQTLVDSAPSAKRQLVEDVGWDTAVDF